MQSVGDVRTLVVRRVGTKRRVVVLGSDSSLSQTLQGNGCEVLVDPLSIEAMTSFDPDVVVAFDGFALDDGKSAFAMLASSLPRAEVVFTFAHAGSATATLAALTGATPPRALVEREVTRWLNSAGYVVASRDIVVVPHVSTDLSADTESALRQLFEQLNPDASADRFLIVAKRGVAVTAAERTTGLLSVVVSAAPDVDFAGLEGTLASLLSQQQRPLELVVASSLSLEQTDRLLAKSRARAGVTSLTVSAPSPDWATRTNVGIAVAQGQYLACLEAGDLLGPFLYSGLVKRLSDGTKAWALAAAQTELPASFSLAKWLTSGAVQRQACLIDRARTATVPLTFAEAIEGSEAMRFARLAAVFEPSWAPTAEGGIERLRATSTSASIEGVLEALRAATNGRPLRMLGTLGELLKPQPPTRLRDVLNAGVKVLRERGRS